MIRTLARSPVEADHVGRRARAAGDAPGVGEDPDDLLDALAVEGEPAEFAGSGGGLVRWVRYAGLRHGGSFPVAGLPGGANSAGAVSLSESILPNLSSFVYTSGAFSNRLSLATERRAVADYLKIPEVARRLDVSEKTARRYVKDGTLPSVFVGGAYRVSEEELEEYLRSARVNPGDPAPKKGRAPLPFEEGRRSSPFLEAWIAYIRQRAEAWEENLERLKDSGSKNPFWIEEWSELAYREASSLFSAIGYAMEASGLFDLTDEQQLELERVCIKLVRATERWRELTKSAWAATYHKGRKLLAEEKAERVAQESQKVIALFEERRSA